MRFLIILILLTCVSTAGAQGTRIDDKEKARLENQFKALKTFYINDDGLVVYNIQEGNSSQNEDLSTEENKTTNNIVKKEEQQQDNSIQIEDREPIYTTPVDKSPRLISKSPINPNDTKATSKNSTNTITSKNTNTVSEEEDIPVIKKEVVQSEISTQPVKTKVVKTKVKEETKVLVNDNLEEEKIEEEEPSKYYSRKAKIQKAPLKYKDMEAAAMAVDNLLSKLKKEQNQNTNRAGSMSSKIAQGAGKSTLRKQTLSEADLYNDDSDYETSQPDNKNILENFYDSDDEGLYTPTYYINGELSNKIEVDNLKKKDIISREFRTRNTVSGNPAGEVWIEVRLP